MIELNTGNMDVRMSALCILVNTGIGPHNTSDMGREDDEYDISRFAIDVNGIVIVNRGKEHHITTAVKK